MVEASETAIYFLCRLTDRLPNPFGCSNNQWIAFDASTPLANRALSVGLTAQAQERKINFNVMGCCNNTYVKATGVQIDPAW